MFAFPRLGGTSIFVLYSLPAYRQGYKWFPISLKMCLYIFGLQPSANRNTQWQKAKFRQVRFAEKPNAPPSY